MTSSIKPTIGRKVWLWVSTDIAAHYIVLDSKQAFDATIVFVNADDTVNVSFTDHEGGDGVVCSVSLCDPGEADQHTGGGSNYCTWMPYQVKTANK